MIISHERRFIFMHCRKTAGSSIKLALFPYLGALDIVIGSLHEIMEAGHRPNAAITDVLKRPLPALVLAGSRLLGRGYARSVNTAVKAHFRYLAPEPSHPSAATVKAHFGREWEDYFKFAFVRNPYSQVVSDYFWIRSRKPTVDISFSRFLDLLSNEPAHPFLHKSTARNWNMIAIGDTVSVDFVGRFERLQDDFRAAVHQLGLPAILNAHSKRGFAPLTDYGDCYNPGDREKVARLFAQEIDVLGYGWPY